nr:hypothetical protein [Tanacetum cinerariifolium]GFB75144.1 hypothetical protein [Tanacetum cinerariifolium]
MDIRSFIMQEIDGKFKFLPEGCIDDNECSPSLKSVNNEAPIIDVKPLMSVHPSDFVEDVVYSDDASVRDNKNPLVGTTLPPLPEAEFPSTKELCDIHDQEYMRQVILDNVLNSRTRELIYALYKATASCDAIRAKELKKEKAYAELERKCNEALLGLDNNPLVADMRNEIETLQGRVDGLHSECTRLVLEEKKWINYDQTFFVLQSKIEGLESEKERLKLFEIQLLQEMDALKQDRASVVAKVVLDAATKLIRSDEMSMLVSKLVKASIMYGRCVAFKEVAKLKDSFIMKKMAGYRPSLKQEYDQAGDDLANTSYHFLSKYVNDPYASME